MHILLVNIYNMSKVNGAWNACLLGFQDLRIFPTKAIAKHLECFGVRIMNKPRSWDASCTCIQLTEYDHGVEHAA